jgi:hypothetical protein
MELKIGGKEWVVEFLDVQIAFTPGENRSRQNKSGSRRWFSVAAVVGRPLGPR